MANLGNTIKPKFVQSSRAAQLSGYSQDYVGQLCRTGVIECRRLHGQWHVNMQSLNAHKHRFSADVRAKQSADNKQDTGHLATVEDNGVTYVASADAAKAVGYTQDYVGQLARSGTVRSKKVGRKWFVDLDSLREHKEHNDKLLAALQSESVGLQRMPRGRVNLDNGEQGNDEHNNDNNVHIRKILPEVTYTRDDGEVIPSLSKSTGKADNVVGTDVDIEHIPTVYTMPHHTQQVHKRQDLRIRKPSQISRISKQSDTQLSAQVSPLLQSDDTVVSSDETYATDVRGVGIFTKFVFAISVLLFIGFVVANVAFIDEAGRVLRTALDNSHLSTGAIRQWVNMLYN